MPVPSYIQSAPAARLAQAQTPMPTVGPSFAGAQQPLPSQDAPAPQQIFFKKHNVVDDIQYAPEDALKEGLGMVKTLQASIKKLDFGSKLRKDVWMREIERYMNRAIVEQSACLIAPKSYTARRADDYDRGLWRCVTTLAAPSRF